MLLVMIFDIMTNNMQPFVSPLPVFCKDSNMGSTLSNPTSQKLQNQMKNMSLSPSTASESLLSVMSNQENNNGSGSDFNPLKSKTGSKVCVTMSKFLLAMDIGNEMVWM